MAMRPPGQMGMLTPVTPIAEEIHFFYNDILTPIIFAVSIFVGALLLYVVYRFNEKANPTPSVLTHHTGLEVAWTIAPVLILVFIAIPSFRLLDHQLVIPKTDMTVKVYWPSMVLDLLLSGRRVRFRLLHHGRQGPENGRSAPTHGR